MAQRWGEQRDHDWVPDLNGIWYMNGNGSAPCQIIQERLDGRALFVNEHGSQAWGAVHGDHVWIPEWTDGQGSPGLRGRIFGNRIVWPNGTFWSR
jgi:hypothetical protein